MKIKLNISTKSDIIELINLDIKVEGYYGNV